MNDKVNIECPHCRYILTLSLAELAPGMWCECLNCDKKIRFTEQDIRHLLEAIRQKK